MNIKVKQATIDDLGKWWDNEIRSNPHDTGLEWYKNLFINDNASGDRITFFAWDSDKIIGQVTLIIRYDGKEVGDTVNKLEVEPEYRGKKVSSLLIKHIEQYAKSKGINSLTIGVEPKEVRNLQIYFHWGFTNFVGIETDPKEKYPYLVYRKDL